MDSILTSFHIDSTTFGKLLKATSAVVAGSAATAAYVTGTPYIFVPNDLDIWVHSDAINALDDHVGKIRDAYKFLFAFYLQQYGYVEVQQPHQTDEEYTSNPVFAILRCIQRFQHPTGRVVQVIHCKVKVDDVLDTFDLSVAATWWRDGLLHTVDHNALMEGRMYSLRPPTTEREIARIEKYKARGFTLEVR